MNTLDADTIPLEAQTLTATFSPLDAILCIILLFLFISSILVSASRIAFFSLTSAQLNKLKEDGQEKTLKLQRNPERLSAAIFLSGLVANTGIAVILCYLLSTYLAPLLAPAWLLVIQLLAIAIILTLATKTFPVPYARQQPLAIVRFMTGPLRFSTFFFKPLISLLASANAGNHRNNKNDVLSTDTLANNQDGTPEENDNNQEQDIIDGITRFGNIDAVDIIRPRINVIAIDEEDSFDTVRGIIAEHGYSRMPVYKDNLDNIIGLLYVKDLLQHLDASADFRWQSLIRPAYFVPETKKINDLLAEFQHNKIHMAIVVDEYGATSGIITMEDIIEEIVGDINDEYDEQEITYTRAKDGTYIFEASTLLNDFYKITDTDDHTFEEVEGDADTLAGLILEIKGELPAKDEIITYGDHTFQVLEVDNRRIKKIRYQRTSPLPDTPNPAS